MILPVFQNQKPYYAVNQSEDTKSGSQEYGTTLSNLLSSPSKFAQNTVIY